MWYRYAAGVLWGGFQEPRSTLSAIYQVALAFVILIAVSAYTAELASFMTSQVTWLGIAWHDTT